MRGRQREDENGDAWDSPFKVVAKIKTLFEDPWGSGPQRIRVLKMSCMTKYGPRYVDLVSIDIINICPITLLHHVSMIFGTAILRIESSVNKHARIMGLRDIDDEDRANFMIKAKDKYGAELKKLMSETLDKSKDRRKKINFTTEGNWIPVDGDDGAKARL